MLIILSLMIFNALLIPKEFIFWSNSIEDNMDIRILTIFFILAFMFYNFFLLNFAK